MSDRLGPRQRRKEARPAELLAAALDVFVEKGFSAARLEEIARRAGVSKGTLYLYYASKEALLKAVVQEAMLPKIIEGEELVEQQDSDPAELLRVLVYRWWHEVGATKAGGFTKLVMAEAGNFPEVARFYLENVVVRGRELFRKVIERGIAAGIFRPVNPALICDFAIKPLVFNAMWHQAFAACDADMVTMDEFLQAHLDFLLNGLLVRPAACTVITE